jgi:hypothetical protein
MKEDDRSTTEHEDEDEDEDDFRGNLACPLRDTTPYENAVIPRT